MPHVNVAYIKLAKGQIQRDPCMSKANLRCLNRSPPSDPHQATEHNSDPGVFDFMRLVKIGEPGKTPPSKHRRDQLHEPTYAHA